MAYDRISDTLGWVSEASVKEIEDEIMDLKAELEGIRIQLDTRRYLTDHRWVGRARSAAAIKRSQIKRLSTEVELRKHLKKQENIKKDCELKIEGVKTKMQRKIDNIERYQAGDKALIKILRAIVGEGKFKEAAKIAGLEK